MRTLICVLALMLLVAGCGPSPTDHRDILIHCSGCGENSTIRSTSKNVAMVASCRYCSQCGKRYCEHDAEAELSALDGAVHFRAKNPCK